MFKKLCQFIFWLVCTGYINLAIAVETINIPKARSIYDLSQDYHKALLQLALERAANGREAPIINETTVMSQGRATGELIRGSMLDVYWSTISYEMADQLRAIPVPTTKGLIGYRKFIIRKESINEFNKIKSVTDLSHYIACQGRHWTDTEILQVAGLQVITTPTYENIFKMLEAKRCDYFPRGYHDIDNEVAIRKDLYNNLVSYHKILLHYPSAVYFFTHKNNETLAKWIEDGLKLLAQEGEIEALMKKHLLTAHIFPLKSEKDTTYIEIINPLLPEDTNITDQNYWFLPKDFHIFQK